MNNPAPAPEKRPQPGPPDRRQLLILFVVSGAVLLSVAVAILVYLGLRGVARPSGGTSTPTQEIPATATMVATSVPEPSCEAIISSGDLDMSLALPVSLTAKSAIYAVEPIVPQEAAWIWPPDRSGEAVWVCGTVVNYVIGIEPTAENEEVVRGLAPGDEVKLRLTSGVTLLFRFAERRDVDPGSATVLAQQRPRLTLVLPKTDTWEIATADYAAEAESMEPPPSGETARPGEAVQVGGARVTLVRGYVEQSDDLPPGTAYYLTEFSVENVGDAPLTSDVMRIRLRDAMGNTYLVSPEASRAGEVGPLSGEIQPGTSAQGSAGFLVPYPLAGGELTWIFSLLPGSEGISVSIPYEGAPGEDFVALQPEVNISDAFLNDGGDTLIIEGEVGNRGARSFVVDRADITLSSSAGTGELITVAPSLPWTIEPGQLRTVELQFQRPEASTVLLELLGFSFEIDGLP